MNKAFQEQEQLAEGRYKKQTKRRQARKQGLKREDYQNIDEPRRVMHRLYSKGRMDLIADAMFAEKGTDSCEVTQKAFEAILGDSHLTSMGLVYKFVAASRAVGKIEIRVSNLGGIVGRGTGFLISPRLMMTNNHVLGSESLATSSQIQFDFYERETGITPGIRFGLSPDEFYLTNPDLDITVVAVNPQNHAGHTLEQFGFIRLIRESGKAVVGEPVNIIQHPDGRPKETAFRENTIVDVVDEFLHYETDTEPGSSGAPVLNRECELAAVHHMSLAKKNSAGKTLLKDGTVWQESWDPPQHLVDWKINEGARVSRIVQWIDGLDLELSQRQLYDECFSVPAPPEFVLAGLSAEPRRVGQEAAFNDGTEGIPVQKVCEADGTVSWYLRVNVGPISPSL